MKAVVASGANQVSLDETHVEPILGPDEVLIKVAASPIHPSDRLNISGNFPRTRFPTIPGRDYAGTIIAPDSSPWYQKRVYGTSGAELSITRNGSHAEFIAVPEVALAEMPHNLDFVQASLVGTPWTTAWLTLARAHAKKGECVTVLGAGGKVGSAVVELARSSLFGCDVLRVGRGPQYDVDTTSDPDLRTLKEKTGGTGTDVLIDAAGNVELVTAGLKTLSTGGRLVIITTGPNHSAVEVKIDLKALYRLEHSVIGCNSLEHSMYETAGWMAELTKAFESGELTPPRSDSAGITKIGLDGAIDAYRQLESGSREFFIIQMDT